MDIVAVMADVPSHGEWQGYKMNVAKKAITAASWTGSLNNIGYAIGFTSRLVLARLLAPEDFGMFAFAVALVGLIQIFTDWSFYQGVIRLRDENDVVDTAFCMALGTGLVTAVIGLGIALAIYHYKPIEVVLICAIMSCIQPISCCATIYAATLEKELIYKPTAIVSSLSISTASALSIVMAIFGYGVWSLIGREVVEMFLMFFGLRYVSPWRFSGNFCKPTARKLFQFGYKMLLTKGLERLLGSVPSLFIGNFLGLRQLGFYSLALYLACIPTRISSQAINRVALSTYSIIQKDKARHEGYFEYINFFLVRFYMMFIFLYLPFSQDVLVLLYGEKWIGATDVLGGLAVYAAVLPVLFNSLTYVFATGEILVTAKAKSVQLLTVLPFLLFGLECASAVPIAYGMSFAAVLSLVVLLYSQGAGLLAVFVRTCIVPVSMATAICMLYYLFFPQYNGSLAMLAVLVSYVLLLWMCEHKTLKSRIAVAGEKMFAQT